MQIPVWRTGIKENNQMVRLLLTEKERYNAGQVRHYIREKGIYKSNCRPYTGKIYYCNLAARS